MIIGGELFYNAYSYHPGMVDLSGGLTVYLFRDSDWVEYDPREKHQAHWSLPHEDWDSYKKKQFQKLHLVA
jgi:hypothetical protein